VLALLALTVPFKVAPLMVMLPAAPVVAVGAGAGPAMTGIPIIILKLSAITRVKPKITLFRIFPPPYYFQ
jgi:hypothetical protein